MPGRDIAIFVIFFPDGGCRHLKLVNVYTVKTVTIITLKRFCSSTHHYAKPNTAILPSITLMNHDTASNGDCLFDRHESDVLKWQNIMQTMLLKTKLVIKTPQGHNWCAKYKWSKKFANFNK